MDLNMPGISGIDTTRNIKKDFPTIQVIILSASAEIEEINEVLQAGASGFLLKSVTGAELEEAILNVAKGGSVLSPAVTRSLLTELKPPGGEWAELTGGELEILTMVVSGASNKAIAEKSILNMRALEAHLSNIFRKLGVKNRQEASDYAVRNNLISALSPN
jgi:DNA-binding NarL/FixJ family response regulator